MGVVRKFVAFLFGGSDCLRNVYYNRSYLGNNISTIDVWISREVVMWILFFTLTYYSSGEPPKIILEKTFGGFESLENCDKAGDRLQVYRGGDWHMVAQTTCMEANPLAGLK